MPQHHADLVGVDQSSIRSTVSMVDMRPWRLNHSYGRPFAEAMTANERALTRVDAADAG